jgi:fumarate reductase subunit C
VKVSNLPLKLFAPPGEASRQLFYELISGASGLVLALFMWGHVILVGSILTGERGFDWLATMLEDYYIAQPTVLFIFVLFLLHAVLAARKIPAQLTERKRVVQLSKDLQNSGKEPIANRREDSPFQPHVESMLWIWQVRTGMVILVLGSFHLILIALDIFTPLFGNHAGLESATTMARVGAGLWLPYALLLLCVEFHAGVGLYRLAIKWGAGVFLSRKTLHRIERVLFWSILGLGTVTLLVLAGLLPPPLEFLLNAGAA